MSQTPAIMMTASLVICAALLWLAAELSAQARVRPAKIGRALLAVSVVLGASALWWPASALHAPAPQDSSRVPHWVWACLPALLLSALACTVGSLWHKGRRPWAAFAAVAMPATAYLYAMLNAPGIFRVTGSGWLGVGTMTLILCAALVIPQLRMSKAPLAHALRAAGGIVAAAAACIGAAMSASVGDAARWVVGPEWLVMGSLVALGRVLLMALRQAGAPAVRTQMAPAASLDHLTGLPSRLFFESRLETAAKRCMAKSSRLAVLFIDLDGFKPVNDTFGHSSGDRVLEQVGQRLKTLARGARVAARVGGDEFLLLVTDAGETDAMADLARSLIDTLSLPYTLDGREVSISCSVGIALYPDKCEPVKLIARADAAMYAAKRAGGARHCFYAPEMDAGTQRNFDLLRDLRLALANDEFELFFQPKIDARSGKVTAAEALLRWNHPTRGLVMPASFIPLAERSGLIGPIGNWVVEAACKQARAWRDKGLRMRVAINISAHQMHQDDIADRIADALARHRIHPSLLTCEITETAAMEDTGATQETFRRLGELGTHLSIDDFGTGYSSLGYLRQLPAEELKIDGSFVKDVDTSADARAVVDAVVKLAHALGLKVVAEGVETRRQHKVLVELGCDELQGFLFAKPMTARALLLWAMDDRSNSAVFRESLFAESRQVTRQNVRQAEIGAGES
jgi:diguanylate cyclase (GGDEF)-like protein